MTEDGPDVVSLARAELAHRIGERARAELVHRGQDAAGLATRIGERDAAILIDRLRSAIEHEKDLLPTADLPLTPRGFRERAAAWFFGRRERRIPQGRRGAPDAAHAGVIRMLAERGLESPFGVRQLEQLDLAYALIAAGLPFGRAFDDAVDRARRAVREAIRRAT